MTLATPCRMERLKVSLLLNRLRLVGILVAVAALLPLRAARAGVTLLVTDTTRKSELSIHLSDPTATSTGINALPYSNYLTYSGAQTTASITASMTTNQFNFSFTQQRPALVTSYAQSQFVTYFTVASKTTYSLSGQFAVTDAAGKASALSYTVYLFDATANPNSGKYLFNETQSSTQTHDASLQINGLLNGDNIATRTVSLDNLEPDHVYGFVGGFFLGESGFSQPPAAATASGNLTISFVSQPTPEPGTATAITFVAGTLLLKRRSRRRPLRHSTTSL